MDLTLFDRSYVKDCLLELGQFPMGFAGSLQMIVSAIRGAANLTKEREKYSLVVIPGFMTSDAHLEFFRLVLAAYGFDIYGWQLGWNIKNVKRNIPLLQRRILDIIQKKGKKVIPIGWSVGGVTASEAYKCGHEIIINELTANTEMIVTLGSPFDPYSAAPIFRRIFEFFNGAISDMDPREIRGLRQPPLNVKMASIFAKHDVVVLNPSIQKTSNVKIIELDTTHSGLVFHYTVLSRVLRLIIEPWDNADEYLPVTEYIPLQLKTV